MMVFMINNVKFFSCYNWLHKPSTSDEYHSSLLIHNNNLLYLSGGIHVFQF